MYIYSFLINGKVKSLFLNNPLSTLTWYQEPNLLGRIFFLFFPFSSMASDTSFSSTNDPITIQNFQDPQHPLLTINLSNITKLSSTNYLTWSIQIQSLLEGYDLHHFIDGAHTPPPPTIIVTGVASPNPAYTIWKCQDHHIFSSLLGTISVSLQPLIAHTTTFLDAWKTLATTYDKPSRGHINN